MVKNDGTVRVCGDYKVSKTDMYPLPKIEELFASLSGGQTFTKLDLSHAYLQVPLAEESQKYLVINTHKGLYAYKRLPFGVASAPAVFQRIMDNILQGLPGVCTYLDDILVTGKTADEHTKNLNAVLTRLREAGMRLKKTKCQFSLRKIEYLGHVISSKGLEPATSKVTAIVDAPSPHDVPQLKLLLGLVNYYGKFLPNLSTTLAPLYKLLRQGVKWQWKSEEATALAKVKEALQSPNLLVHFDSAKPLLLACDASPVGVGAVLSHRLDDGTEKPISYASRTLSAAERKYSQLDKEALAIIFGVKHYHQYLYGREFVILSDHKPLKHIFNASKSTPAMASARIQRWAILLGGYHYRIEYKSGQQNANADAFSRLPLSTTPLEIPTPPEVIHMMELIDTTPVSVSQIRTQTAHDPTLSRVKELVMNGWTATHTLPPEFQPFVTRELELSIQNDCLLWGSRVIVPPKLRDRVLQELHNSHPGSSRMKSLARQYIWWPGLNQAIENMVKSCKICQGTRNKPPSATLHPWDWPQKPWQRVHADYAGPFLGRMFLILVEANTKWVDIHVVNSTSAEVTIEKMRATFATLGLPQILVTDNGPQFTSAQFAQFTKNNGIKHVTSSPYHPSTNGLAERMVQTFKEGMRRQKTGSIETRIARFLFAYRNTPQSTTGVSPAVMMFKRPLRCHLDLLKPNIEETVQARQIQQQLNHDVHSKDRKFQINDTVYVENFAQGSKWLEGIVEEIRGPLTYMIKLPDGRILKRHVDHIRNRISAEPSNSQDVPSREDSSSFGPQLDTDEEPQSEQLSQSPEQHSIPIRSSSRIRRPPDRFCPDS